MKLVHQITLFLLFIAITACSPEKTLSETENEVITQEINETVTAPTSEKDYQEFHPNGALKIEGDYDNKGQRNGLWVSYYENGIKWSESYYVNGKRSGHSITFFPNGRVRYVGEYKNDEKIGKWSFYDEEGNLIEEKEYE